MKKQVVAAIVSIPLTAILLTGCGGGSDEKAQSPESSATQEGGGVREQPGGQPTASSTKTPGDNENSTSPSATPSASSSDGGEININPSAPPSSAPTTKPSENSSAPPSSVPSTAPTTPSDNDGGGSTGNDNGSTGNDSGSKNKESEIPALGPKDGTVVYVKSIFETTIYSSPSLSSKALGTVKAKGGFKGTVTEGGKWVKIDRSPGYVPATDLKVDQIIEGAG